MNVSASLNDFSYELFSNIIQTNPTSDVFVSPASLFTCLAMIMVGARNHTFDQLLTGLKLKNFVESQSLETCELRVKLGKLVEELNANPNVRLSNMILVNEGLTSRDPNVFESYKTRVKNTYAADVKDVKFATEGEGIKSTVNEWAKEATNGLIDPFMTEAPNAQTLMMLLNALYFKGTWKYSFNENQTREQPFYSMDGQNNTVKLMRVDEKFPYAEINMAGRSVHTVKVPYNHNTSMILLIPTEIDGLASIQSHANFKEELAKAVASLRTTDLKVHLRLPRFEMQTEYDLNPLLEKMGLGGLFGSGADFSGIVEGMSVSNAKQKAAVKVNEEGTEAAAVTSVIVKLSLPLVQEDVWVDADRPFLFAIQDDMSKAILFLGAKYNP